MSAIEDSLVTYFREIEDYRENHNKKHLLVDILAIVVLGAICGADSFVEIRMVADAKKAWLQTFLELPYGIPSHDTINRVMGLIHPKAFEKTFRSWVSAAFPESCAGHIAIDGKELHYSQDGENNYANVRMIAAWSVEHQIVLGQTVVADESNEITAAPLLLDLFDLENCHFTADALHCQTSLTTPLTNAHAGFTIGVKANKKQLYERIKTTFDRATQAPSAIIHRYTTTDKNHGRLERRAYAFTTDIQGLGDLCAAYNIQGIGMVESQRWIGEKHEQETRYYIHRGTASVEAFATYVRGHWSIENQLHWRLDVIFREDAAHIRKNYAAENMAVMRHIAVNLLANERTVKLGMKAKRLKAACDNIYLEKIIAGQNNVL